MEIFMAQTQVEVTKTTPSRMPDVWQSFRSDMDRLFDRFAGGFSLPSLRRMFDAEPAWRPDSSLSFSAPAVDVTEDEKT
jgi:HSP20 family protein